MNFDIDATIFVGFLTVTLIAGLYYGRGVKTIQDMPLVVEIFLQQL